MQNKLCPCCPRRCYLDEPNCERGKIYAETGEIPPRKPRLDENGKPIQKKHSPEREAYMKLTSDQKLIANLQTFGNMESLTEEALSVLREDDREYLLLILEKLKHSLHHRNGDEHKN